VNYDPPVPLEEDLAKEIEDLFQSKVWVKALPYRKDLALGNTAVVFGPHEIRLYENDVLTKLSLIVKSENKAGVPLVRAPLDIKKVPHETVDVNNFSHLIFTVHGIGQRIEQFDIIDDVQNPSFPPVSSTHRPDVCSQPNRWLISARLWTSCPRAFIPSRWCKTRSRSSRSSGGRILSSPAMSLARR